jgi:predicted RNA methylase
VDRVAEWRLFEAGTVPEYTTAEWYLARDGAPHLDQDTHRPRLVASARAVAALAHSLGLHSVVDLGAGDGGLLSLLGPALKAWGYDLCPDNVSRARHRKVDVRFGDVLEDPVEWGRIAVATEMLEHLIDPHTFVRTIAQHADALVCSSPWNEHPTSHYEFHTWAWDLDGYRALIEQAGFAVTSQEKVGPFQVTTAVKP